MFVPDLLFQPCIMFVGKTRSLAAYGWASLGNIILCWEGFPRADALDYSEYF
jgi:hypothetical protein